MDLQQASERVHGREGLADFVAALRGDMTANPAAWENVTLESYLEAMEAWIRDMDGYYINRQEAVPEHPSWKMFANILIAAGRYE